MTAAKVVDASALAAATFHEPGAPIAQARLREGIFFAPTILRFEMASVCLKKLRSRPAERDAILLQYDHSLAFPVQEHLVNQSEVLIFAEQFNLSTYDASYLWLARHLDAELITLDQQLRQAALAV